MSSYRAAWAVAVAFLIGAISPTSASAEPVTRRPVAVIDLTLSNATVELANGLRDQLNSHLELRALMAVSFEAALVGTPPDDDAQWVGSAETGLANATQSLGRTPSAAESSTDTAMSRLAEVTPTVAAPLFAKLAFVRGQAQVALKNQATAIEWFTLVRAIDTTKTLDPDQYFPEVIEAFGKAKVDPAQKTATIDVRGTGEVWVDGASYGSAPREIRTTPGRHLVQLTGVERLTRGGVYSVTDRVIADIPDVVAAPDVQIRRARVALAHANGSVERAATITHLAKLLGVGDAILLSMQNGRIMVQSWRDRAPGFSKVEDLAKRTAPEVLLLLAPPPPPAKVKEPPLVLPLPEGPRWYRDRRVQVGVAIGVVVVVAASILWATSGIGTFNADENITAVTR